jgi:hypothetical protein
VVKYEDMRGVRVRGKMASRLEPVHVRHADVEQHDVGSPLAGEGKRLDAVAGLGDHLDVLLRLEDHAEPAAHERLVVGDENTDHDGGDPIGSRARTAKPPSGRGPTSSSPP